MFGEQGHLATAMAWVIVTFLWEATVLGALAFVALRLSARIRPTIRYALSVGLLASLIALPIATAARFDRVTRGGEDATGIAADLFSGTDQSEFASSQTIGTPSSNSPLTPLAAPRRSVLSASVLRVETAWFELQQRLLTAVAPITGVILVMWLVGALSVAVRLLLDLKVIGDLRRASSSRLPSTLASRVPRLKHALGLQKPIAIVLSNEVEVPVVLGLLSPLVLVPAPLVSTLAEQEIEMLIAHELAHVKRRDYAVNIAQVVVESLFFFHPVTWWLSARVREEREHCCDERALELTAIGDRGARQRYIAALLAAEEARSETAPRLAPSASRGSLLRRAREILRSESHERPGTGMYATIAAFAVTLGILTVSPQPSLAALRMSGESTEFLIWSGPVPREGWLRVRNLVGDIVVEPASGQNVEVAGIGWRPGVASPLSFQTTRQDDGVTVCGLRPGVDCDENGNVLHISPSELYSDSVMLVVRIPEGINLLVASSDGALRVGARAVSVHAQAGRGEITVRGARGSVEAATGGGQVRVENVAGDVIVRSGGGAVSLGEIAGDVEVRASSGDINAALDAGAGAHRWSFQTSSGSIRLSGRSLERAKIEIDANGGRIDSDFPYVTRSRAIHATAVERASGASVLTASTSNGEVSIRSLR